MVTLVCALVGVKGNAFSIDINASKLVDHLKDAIKAKKENNLKAVDADKLHLFLAKNGDGTWLESSTDDVKKLKKGEKTALIEALTHEDNELDGEFGLEEVLDGMPEPKTKQIHVLVVLPSHVVVSDENDRTTRPVHPSEDRKRRFDELNRILSQAGIEASDTANKKAKQSFNLSSIKWEIVAPLFEPSTTEYEQEEKNIPEYILKELQAYSARAFECFDLGSCSEATLNIFIAPVLIQVCSLFGGDIKIYAEKTLRGNYVKANGRFEFVLKRGLKSIFIVETKKDDFDQGAAQELVGAEVAAELGSLDVVYGIVTNFKEWVFYKSSNNKIERDRSLTFHPGDARSMETTLAKVTGKIYAMLSE